MPKKIRNYKSEFKAEAVKLALSSDSISGTAKELGMPEATLRTWVKKAKNQGDQTYELPSGEKGTVNVGPLLSENN